MNKGKWHNGLLARIKCVKNIEYYLIAIVFLVGMLIFIAPKGVEMATNKSSVEIRLENTLSNIKGAGKVSVMVTYESSGDQVVDVFSNSSKDKGAVCGVIVVAEGASSVFVKLEILKATAAAIGVPISMVEVFEMKK